MNEENARALTDVLLALKKACDDLLSVIAKTQVEQPPERQVKPPQTLEELQQLIPSDLANLLEFEEAIDHFVVKPRAFLGSSNFVKVASIIRSLGGVYVSSGKASHFEVPRARGN